MSAASLLVAFGALATLATVAVILAPVLSADMRRAVQRGMRHQGQTNATAITLMVFGSALMGVVGVGSLFLGATWS